jgi:hypothetical protein
VTGADLLRKHLAELSEAVGLHGHVIEEGSALTVILFEVTLPTERFSRENSDVLFRTDSQYPVSAMDMFWVEVEVVRADGNIPQNAESIEHYCGRAWRRFSWHRNSVWNSNGNPLLDHYAFMESRLMAEPPSERSAA